MAVGPSRSRLSALLVFKCFKKLKTPHLYLLKTPLFVILHGLRSNYGFLVYSLQLAASRVLVLKSSDRSPLGTCPHDPFMNTCCQKSSAMPHTAV